MTKARRKRCFFFESSLQNFRAGIKPALFPECDHEALAGFLRAGSGSGHVLAVEFHDVISDQDRLCLALARSQRLEIESVVAE